jgi:hypothetical protein
LALWFWRRSRKCKSLQTDKTETDVQAKNYMPLIFGHGGIKSIVKNHILRPRPKIKFYLFGVAGRPVKIGPVWRNFIPVLSKDFFFFTNTLEGLPEIVQERFLRDINDIILLSVHFHDRNNLSVLSVSFIF